jgi:hypothetical protein
MEEGVPSHSARRALDPRIGADRKPSTTLLGMCPQSQGKWPNRRPWHLFGAAWLVANGYVAWVADGARLGLPEALTTWFGPPKAA